MTAIITRIDAATLEGRRPRAAGSNARLGFHGDRLRLPLVRLTTSDGATGFGRCGATRDQLATLLGANLEDLMSGGAVDPAWERFEYPLLDLAARREGVSVARYLRGEPDLATSRVRTYDTSLYFDDLDLEDDAAAADLIVSEAREGWALGHRAFKIKVGRGARHMPLEEGTVRDIRIIRAVREAAGPDATVMIDANNGWNLNLTKRVLAETADTNLYWLEEAFHEDNVLYEDLRAWQAAEGLAVLVADGEGAAHPALVEWARAGVVDVVQYDIFQFGLGRWLPLGRELEQAGVRMSPHTYGGGLSPYVTTQFAGVVSGIEFVEWDAGEFTEIDATAYAIVDGVVDIPSGPGFGLELDHAAFDAAVVENGFTLT
jgi:L-alanine-DL-glutamate epimerase-like enolase superfamily enzyme